MDFGGAIFACAKLLHVVAWPRWKSAVAGSCTARQAGVVGVVLNLALVFGAAVLWPQGLAGGTDWFAAVLSGLAFVMLYRFKVDVLWVVLAGGIIGWAKMHL